MYCHGVMVRTSDLGTIESFCKNRKIDYEFWDINDLIAPKKEVELTFETTENRQIVMDFMKRLRN